MAIVCFRPTRTLGFMEKDLNWAWWGGRHTIF